jgi:hypothetical protein
MKSPVGLAMWIAKFVFTLVLMLVLLPAGLIYGSIYAYGKYEAWQEAKAVAVQKAQTAQVRALIFDPKFPRLSMGAQQAALSHIDPDFSKLSPKGFVEAETGLWETGSEGEKTRSLGGPDPYAEFGGHAVAPFSDLPMESMPAESKEDLAREWARQQACKKNHWTGSGCAELLQRQACAMGAVDAVCQHLDLSRAVCFNADGTETPCKKSNDPYAAIAEPVEQSGTRTQPIPSKATAKSR